MVVYEVHAVRAVAVPGRSRFVWWGLITASLLVTGGVAINQVFDDGKLSWTWAYLALVVTVLAGLAQTAQMALQPGPPRDPTGERAGTGVSGTHRGRVTRRGYLRRVRLSVDQMETIGLVTQSEFVLRTRQVYVDVALQPRPVVDVAGDSGTGPAPAATEIGKRAPLAEFLAPTRVLAVLGAAGAGKTTLARYTALEMADRRWRPWQREFWQPRQIPVLLYLRDHAAQILADLPVELAEVAVSAPWLDGEVPAAWLKQRLARGRCVVLLDGLDEVADIADRKSVVRWVENQISRHPQNAYVVTSRPLGYQDSPLRNADTLQVQRFTSGQIRAFLHVWYRAIEHRARQADPHVIDRIADRAADDLYQRISTRVALYDLAANPLLLTMIANVHRYRGSLPGGRVGLYTEMCQVLLHRRDEAKNLAPAGLDTLNEDTGDKKERVVQELALHMMRHRLRDISATDAHRVIRPILERTAPDVTPETFLAFIRRSGLILERRHQRYGFAHLTFQEYLAAALIPNHHTRRQLLVDNVSDPWWRETTLLWAARNDASPVVQACLTARTVSALHLAYSLDTEARELDPHLRDQLNQILTATPLNPEQARLLDGVTSARALHDLHTLDDGTRICAAPITCDLWNRYAAHTGTHLLPPGTAPAALWPNDIRGFLTWLNGLFADGTGYRLPTPEEAHQVLQHDLYPVPGSSLWTLDDDSIRLTHHADTPHPHRPTREQVDSYPDLIQDHTYLLLRLLLPRSHLTFSQLLTYSLPRDLKRPEHQFLQSLDLIIALDLARLDSFIPDLALSPDLVGDLERAYALTRALARDLGLVADLALDRARALARDLERALARHPERPRDLDRALDLVLDLIRVLDLDLDRALDRARALALALDPDSALDPADPADPARVLDSDSALDPARALARVLDPDSALDLDFDLERVRVLDSILVRTLERTHGLGPGSALSERALDPDPGLALALALAHIRDLAPLHNLDFDLALALALDLAFARELAAIDKVVDMRLGRACAALLETFFRERAAKPGGWYRGDPKTTGASFFDFLALALTTLSPRQPVDDLESMFDRAEHLTRESHVHNHNIGGLDELIRNARRLAAPLWDRSQSDIPQSGVVQAAVSLLAVLMTLSERETDTELTELLSAVLATLIALTPGTHPNDVPPPVKLLFLIRN
ncbi:NACHT domain-containing protein [Streptosporangium sp. NPDC023963]|uniref:NACHT domain-containing protein n=1 Tax=Streptosporangium sp. NPDC023963 TaxID=3155608 RepID=UPI0034177B5D